MGLFWCWFGIIWLFLDLFGGYELWFSLSDMLGWLLLGNRSVNGIDFLRSLIWLTLWCGYLLLFSFFYHSLEFQFLWQLPVMERLNLLLFTFLRLSNELLYLSVAILLLLLLLAYLLLLLLLSFLQLLTRALGHCLLPRMVHLLLLLWRRQTQCLNMFPQLVHLILGHFLSAHLQP